jgi:hypothetical protein
MIHLCWIETTLQSALTLYMKLYRIEVDFINFIESLY